MGLKRVVHTDFWTDSKVDEFSPEDKYFMLWLLTNPRTTQLGIYEMSIRQAAFQLGYSVEAVKVLLDRFENKYGMIIFSEETNEVAIKNFLRHSVVKGGKPVEDCIKREIMAVKNKQLIKDVFGRLSGMDGLNETVKKIVEEYEYLNDNDNDNDNDDSWPTNRKRSGDESSESRASEEYRKIKESILAPDEDKEKKCEWCGHRTTTLHRHHYPVPKRLGGKDIVNICANCHTEFHAKEAKVFGGADSTFDGDSQKPNKPVRHKHGEYKNVLLSDDDLAKLQEEFPNDWADRIERLSSYMASTGKSYKNHLVTIRNWAKRDNAAKGVKRDAEYELYASLV